VVVGADMQYDAVSAVAGYAPKNTLSGHTVARLRHPSGEGQPNRNREQMANDHEDCVVVTKCSGVR